MGLKNTLFRFAALFGLLLAIGAVTSVHATVTSAAVASAQDSDTSEGADTADDSDSADDTDTDTDTDTEDTTATSTGTTLPDTGVGSSVAATNGGLTAAMMATLGLIFATMALTVRRRASGAVIR